MLPGDLQVSLNPATGVLRICPSLSESWVRALERDAILCLNGLSELAEHLTPRYHEPPEQSRPHLRLVQDGQRGVG